MPASDDAPPRPAAVAPPAATTPTAPAGMRSRADRTTDAPARDAAAPPRRGFRLSALEAEEAERMNRRIAHGWDYLCCNV